MSFCVTEDGKDKQFFITRAYKGELDTGDADDDSAVGVDSAVLDDGEIDWDCPCIKPMTEGPCGTKFMDSFECFVQSDTDPKGMECYEKFRAMQECMTDNREYYGAQLADNDEAEGDESELDVVDDAVGVVESDKGSEDAKLNGE